MTAPMFVLRPLADAVRLTLEGPEGRHAATVRRLRVGERLDLTDGQGRLAECLVASVGRDRLEVDVVGRAFEPEPEPRVVVVQALVKGDRSELAVELLTEVGVDEIVPWAAKRCVASWVPERSGRKWEQAATAAAKQARRPRWPVVADLVSTKDLESRISRAEAAFVLHEDASEPLAGALAAPPSGRGELLIVVGPEGGLTEDEIDGFTQAGAHAVRLGPSVLRASTAGCAAAAVVLAATGRWN
jgi:16S rRNA (uracil1498-N3)-methyltransferase